MKKKLLVAALVASFAGFTGVAQADSVVLYGTLDGGLGFNTYTLKQNENNVQTTVTAGRGFVFENGLNKRSRLGFKGDAFIWGQTSAIFKLEMSLNILNGMGGFSGGLAKLFDRAAYFGFTSPAWGTVTAGFQSSASDKFAILPFSNFGIGKALPSGKLGGTSISMNFKGGAFGKAAGNKTASFMYVTPRFAGFQLGLSHDFNLQYFAQPTQNVDAPNLEVVSFQRGNKSESHQHTSVALDFAMGPVELAATYDLYTPIGKKYLFGYDGSLVAPDKNANNAEQSYTVGAKVNIRGIEVSASWAQAFSDIAFQFGQDSQVGGGMGSNFYATFINPEGGVTNKFRNNAFGASITIPATEQGKFYFAYTGSITTATLNHALQGKPTMLDPSKPSTNIKAFTQLWRAGYVQNISQYTSLYVYAGFGDVKFSQKPVTQKDWTDSDELGTARIQQYGLGITHNF